MLNEVQRRELCSGAYGLVDFDVPMSDHTTFRIGGPADVFIEPTSEKELIRCVRFLRTEGIPLCLIGNGSNLLVRDGGIRGAVVKLGRRFSDITVEGDRIRVQAGAQLSAVAKMSFRAELTGMETISGIPGSIGGAVAMNAGAYGGEMKDVVESVRVIDSAGEVVDIPAEEMSFSYRHSRVQDEHLIVVEVSLRLSPGNPEQIEERYKDYTERRITKQPLDKASAGSTFKRPSVGFASALIDEAGFRGYSVGDAQVSTKHCGFLVNNGKASAKDVLELIKIIQDEIYEKKGIHLEPEVRIIGEE